MKSSEIEETLQKIVKRNPRYHRDAYLFVQEGLDFTLKKFEKPNRKPGHISGQELLEGIRELAIEQFGPMARTVFTEWGIFSCEDFGEIVFILVEHELLSKNERDSREDFKDGYDFFETFEKPYLPTAKLAARQKPAVMKG